MAHVNKRLDALTGIRFFAAIGVVFYHFWVLSIRNRALNVIVQNGYMGVSLFFILSGYILTYVYVQDADTVIDRKRFWASRFARIYPIYVVSFLIQVPQMIAYVAHSGRILNRSAVAVGTLAANLAMVQVWVYPLKWRWNYPSWSLSVEAVFYMLFPALAVWLAKKESIRKTVVITAVAGLLSIAPSLVASFRGIGVHPTAERTLPFFLVTFSPWFRIPQFLFGMGLARLDRHWKERSEEEQRSRWGALLFAAGILGVATILVFNERIPYITLYTGAADVPFGLTILGLANARGLIARFFSMQWLVRLGEASYSLYILQMPIHEAYFAFVPHTNAISLSLYVVLLVGASLLSFQYLETPVRRALLRRSDAKENFREASFGPETARAAVGSAS